MTDSETPALPSTPAASLARRARLLLEPYGRSLVPGLIAVALMVVWAIHNGGYDADTWYWGALVTLALLGASVVALGGWGRIRVSRTSGLAVAALAAYVAWSYGSIAWAGSQGDALQGSNRALLYALLFTLMLVLPWTAEGALVALIAFTLALGAVALLILLRLASQDHVSQLVVDGRLASPTGYFNSTAALFTIDAGLAIVLAARRELPGLLRGVLVAMAAASLQLAVIGQSRGWLFTLPIVVIIVIAVVRDRLRVAATAVLPLAATLIPVHRLIGVFTSDVPSKLNHAASRAGRTALLLCAATLVLATLIAWAERLTRPRALTARRKRQVGAALAALAILGGFAGSVLATHGDPFGFVSRQWRGFSHPPTSSPSGSHFATVGSGRYDFWRVSLDAFLAHPIGGLGQDNFADYYITRRRTNEEPSWTHSFEMRLLAHTGFVGFALFAAFLVCALTAAATVRRRGGPLASMVAGAALVPLAVWLIHGSVDWFWEFPALTGPALGFLGMSMALGASRAAPSRQAATGGAQRIPRGVQLAAGAIALLALVMVLGFPYLSVREVSAASDLRQRNPGAALRDLGHAASLNPLSAVPGRLAGTIALQSGDFVQAEQRFRQSIDRESGGWFAWFGDGLAASALGDSARARHDYLVASSINRRQRVVKDALTRVDSLHPLTPSAALSMLVLVT